MERLSKRPKPAKTVREIRTMGYEGERQRQVTNGWYARGEIDRVTGEWRPEPGLPSDIFVYLPMGAPYEREMYPAKGYRPLSIVPNKKAIALRPSTGEFRVDPPEFEELQAVLVMLKERAPEAQRAVMDEIAEIDEALADSGSLMKGEAPSLRIKRKKLAERLKKLDDPASFDPMGYYESFVRERLAVISAQMRPEELRHAELQREYGEWQEHLEKVEQLVAEPASTS